MTNLAPGRIKRDGTADLLKGLAVLFMIQVHLMEQFVTPDIYNSLIGKVSMFLGGPVCAPVFLAVMGYFMATSAKPLSYFLKRGGLLFLGGILLNTARSANLLLQITQGKVNLDPWFFIMGADILTLAGISLILTGFLRLLFRDLTWLYFVFAVAIAAVSPWLHQPPSSGIILKYVIPFLWGEADWSYFPVFPWFAYVLTGYAFRLFLAQTPIVNNLELQHQYIYFVPVFIGVIITLPYAAGITQHLEGAGGYYHHGIVFFGWVLMFMTAYLVLVKLFEATHGNNRTAGVIKWIGQKVTTLYVIQWLIIGNLATWLFRSQGLLQFIGWFAIVTAATLLIGYAADKIRKV